MSLADLVAVDTAVVWKGETRAATLSRGRGTCVFAYAPEYAGPPVATSLPRSADPVVTAAGAIPPFFAGLLPEGRRLGALRRAVKTSADDELSMLLAVGADAVGDVRVTPPAPPGDQTRALLTPADLRTTTFRDLFRRALSEDTLDPVALPGVQDKLSGGMMALPVAWAGHPVILKLEPPEFPHVVRNEAFFLDLARALGLDVPDHEVLSDAEGALALLVRRFDRVRASGDVWRGRAQEDGCQVLSLYPADKYRPAVEEVILALSGVCGAPVVAAQTFLRQVAFAYLTCNGDLHAKNLSVVMDARGEWSPSPAYDLPTTHPYGDVTMALSIGGRRRDDIGRDQFVALGAATGLTERAVARALDGLIRGIGARLDALEGLPFDPRRRHKLRRAIAWRLARLSR